MKIKQGKCKGSCGVVKIEKEDSSLGGTHIIHLVLTLFTGVWAIIWIIHGAYDPNKWRCSQCGSKAK